MRTFDLSPCVVSGVLEIRRARVIWRDSKLYVWESPTQVTVMEASEPTRNGDAWETTVAGGVVRMRRSGCNCGFPLGKMSRTRLFRSLDG